MMMLLASIGKLTKEKNEPFDNHNQVLASRNTVKGNNKLSGKTK